MIFQKSIIGKSRTAANQWSEVNMARIAANVSEEHHAAVARAAGITVNDGFIPRDVYQEFDNVTVERMRSDDGDTFLNDLLPLSRSISIGKLVHQFRQASDAGRVQTSMSGQVGVKMDQVEFTYDGSIIPVHDTGFGRNWRELNAQSSEGFDSLIDDQRESVASIRSHIADSFLDGQRDTQGNLIVLDGISWGGMRNDTRVAQVDLGAGGVNFDFTDQTKTGAEIKAAFITVRDVLRISNNCSKDAVFYVSREIGSNLERKFSTSYDAKIIMQELADLAGVSAIKETNKMVGNELMAFPLDSNVIRPMVGMGVNTVAMPRPMYNSNHDFAVWAAIGWEVRTDFEANTCALYAADMT